MNPRRFIHEIEKAFETVAEPKAKQWWERYLKGTALFRGVKMADTRRIVDAVVERNDLRDATATVYIELAHACLSRPMSEDKLAGVLLLAEHGLNTLTIDHVPDLAAPFGRGHIADWNVCDWYCVKVLGPFVTAADDVRDRAHALAAWTSADDIWQRRASLVAFVNHAATEPELFAGFTRLLLELAHANAEDPTRWSQTSVGWVLRELSRRNPRAVRDFIDSHPHLSTEARKNALKHIGPNP